MTRVQSERITSAAGGSKLLVKLIDASLSSATESEFLASALQLVNEQVSASGSVLVQGAKGNWRVLAHSGAGDGLPTELLADTLDAESCQQSEGWTASPLVRPNRSSRLLASNVDSIDTAEFDSLTAAVGLALESFQQRSSQSRRAQRLEAMLEMTVHWNQSRQTDELLEQIAQTSTRLLGAERATIFLPDATSELLIGKPALGVEDGVLRIPANAGVVGQVMKLSLIHI